MKDKDKEPDYKKGFVLLLEFWEYIPEEEHEQLNKELKKLGL